MGGRLNTCNLSLSIYVMKKSGNISLKKGRDKDKETKTNIMYRSKRTVLLSNMITCITYSDPADFLFRIT